MDIKTVGIPLIRADMSEKEFVGWCEKHKWTGDISGVYADLRKKAGKPIKKKKKLED